ncbi:MoaF-related domain-containing protein [Nocardia sp. NBC_01327]|uniref:MoaF-related domain-containing protein n=1 Tax=Nocardia sp. NBC_01327 TaxID=2903593 RepID=UPI002E141932|nr:MoaF N-terminal domain-containing protein [Nocardia sp. NBC_01327]
MGRLSGVVALVAVALSAAGCVADPAPPHKVSASESAVGMSATSLPADLHGKSVLLSYDSGSGGTATFADDGRTITYIAADTGRKTTSPVVVEPLDTGVFLVTWTDEGSGAVVSQVQDYRTGKVQGTWSRHSDAAAAPAIETRTGSVHLAD